MAGVGGLRAARFAVAVVFFLNGFGFSNWVVRIPAVRDHLGLDKGTLGLALLGASVGSLISMPLVGGLAARFGSRPVVGVMAAGFCVVLALPGFAGGAVALALSLVVVGVFMGGLDVSMNTQAVAVERGYGRPIMSSFHAMFSLGGLAGSVVGGVA
uniref:MFS transporter n=1 Tax=Rubrobacter calidifluminis TaxID=1392640 RepID=UPI00235EEAEA